MATSIYKIADCLGRECWVRAWAGTVHVYHFILKSLFQLTFSILGEGIFVPLVSTNW